MSSDELKSDEVVDLNSDVDSVVVNKESVQLSVNKPRELTPKNRLFLQLLSEGKSTLEAYELAGYKGERHAAYQLRSDLKEELIKTLEGQGIDRAGLMFGVKQLLELPLRETEISVKTKIDLLKLLAKVVPQPVETDKPKITAFVVNNHINSNNSPQPTIDVTDAL